MISYVEAVIKIWKGFEKTVTHYVYKPKRSTLKLYDFMCSSMISNKRTKSTILGHYSEFAMFIKILLYIVMVDMDAT